jgi:Lon protease-like protein
MNDAPDQIELFPLQAVLFPGGLLNLKVFEARYLDLVGRCVRESRPFGVVALMHGSEVHRRGEPVELMGVGTLAQLLEIDSATPGILQVRCRGLQRFTLREARQQAEGLWQARAEWIDDDDNVAPESTHLGSVRGLMQAIATLKAQGTEPFLEPHRFDQAGWVANRWCEILPIPLAAKQKLMELPDPRVRLRLVDDFLRSRGVVVD